MHCLQTYKLSTDATGASCLPNDTTRNKLLIAGIVLACVLLLAVLLAIIMFWRYGLSAIMQQDIAGTMAVGPLIQSIAQASQARLSAKSLLDSCVESGNALCISVEQTVFWRMTWSASVSANESMMA